MPPSIRKPNEKDLEAWLRLRCRLWPSASPEEHRDELVELRSNKDFYCLIAELDGLTIGFLEAFVRPFANGCKSRPVPFLEGIWIEPEFRKKGVSRQLLSEFEKWAISNGFNEIGSDVEIDNQSSLSAHQAWGYQETERVVYFRKKLPT